MNRTAYENYFRSKRITVMGLGLLGRGLNLTKFLAEMGARLTVTDLKPRKDLVTSLSKLSRFKNIRYVLGKHRREDFRRRDLIIKAAGVPFDSVYIREAERHNIPVKMDASLFAELAPGVTLIGITGTRGKSTATHLIHQIIKRSGRRIFLGGNVRGLATLPLLKTVQPGDIVVLELDSWQLQGFGEAHISPHIAVFTSFMRDHQNYYRGDMAHYFSDKANVYRFQRKNDHLVTSRPVSALIKKKLFPHRAHLTLVGSRDIPAKWRLRILGEHNRQNAAYAVAVARIIGIKKEVIRKTLEEFSALPGRLEHIRTVRGVAYYNDTTATTPDGTIAALKALRTKKRNIIVIGGGADKALEYDEYQKVVKRYAKALVLFKGAATEKIVSSLGKTRLPVVIVSSMKEALANARNFTKRGDIVLLSPAAASFGLFKNEFDRGTQFDALVRSL